LESLAEIPIIDSICQQLLPFALRVRGAGVESMTGIAGVLVSAYVESFPVASFLDCNAEHEGGDYRNQQM